MERLRRVCSGRLSEIFGERTLGVDKFFRTIGLYHSASGAVKNLDDDQLMVLQAYADGVNDFLSNVNIQNGKAARLLPPEFYLIQHFDIEEWTAADTVCIYKLLNFHLSWNWG